MSRTGITTCVKVAAQRNTIEARGMEEYKLKPKTLENELPHRQIQNQDW